MADNCRPSFLNPCQQQLQQQLQQQQAAESSSSFSLSTFGAAFAVCVILLFTVATAVCIIRRLRWFEINLDTRPAHHQHPRVIWVRNLHQVPAVPPIPGLDRATIKSFPVFTYRGADNPKSDTPLVSEAGVPAAATCGANRGDHVAVTVAHVDSDGREMNERMQSMRECTVCLGDYIEGERIKVVPACGHGFHAECIDLWLSAKPTCPICRCDLAPAKADDAKPADVVTGPGDVESDSPAVEDGEERLRLELPGSVEPLREGSALVVETGTISRTEPAAVAAAAAAAAAGTVVGTAAAAGA